MHLKINYVYTRLVRYSHGFYWICYSDTHTHTHTHPLSTHTDTQRHTHTHTESVTHTRGVISRYVIRTFLVRQVSRSGSWPTRVSVPERGTPFRNGIVMTNGRRRYIALQLLATTFRLPTAGLPLVAFIPVSNDVTYQVDHRFVVDVRNDGASFRK